MEKISKNQYKKTCKITTKKRNFLPHSKNNQKCIKNVLLLFCYNSVTDSVTDSVTETKNVLKNR